PRGAREMRRLRRRARDQGGRHRRGPGGPAPRLSPEDQPGARHLPPQGIRADRRRPARQGGGPAGHPGPARPAAPPPGPAGGRLTPMRVVVAPDSFKGSIGAAEAAAALAEGWRAARPGDELVCLPLADGGEGTLQVLAAADPAARWHPVPVTGPDGGPVPSRWLERPDG